MMRLSDIRAKMEEYDRILAGEIYPQDYKDHIQSLKNSMASELNKAIAREYAPEPTWRSIVQSKGRWR